MLPRNRSRKHTKVLWLTLSIVALATSGLAFRAGGQEPAAGPLPTLPGSPRQTPKSVEDFVKSLTVNDATFDVTVGQGRILTTKVDLTAPGKAPALVAVGDPSVAEFSVISSRQIRIIGQRTGVTDLSITTGDGQVFTFEVRVLANLDVLRVQLLQSFPDASIRLGQLRDHVIVEGQARDATQVGLILDMIKAFLKSVEVGQERKFSQKQGDRGLPKAAPPDEAGKQPAPATPEVGGRQVIGTIVEPQLINLLRIPGPQQVLLKVRVAELDRTALREIGADMLFADKGGNIIGTQIGGATVGATGNAMGGGRISAKSFLTSSSTTTIFGLFGREFEIMLDALRRNQMVKILAEPNLVAMNGHKASFLAGGQFPVPVPQTSSGGAAPTVTVEFKDFGVKLGFVPTILDNNTIRLSVDPEVSTIDFSIGTVLVPGGTPVPGLQVRNAHTTVELRETQTLAIAGLLSVTLEGSTSRIPGLGDLPVLGPFFSNTTSKRTEKELIVLVTPYLVEGMPCEQVPASPGAEVGGPNDLEFFLGNRIEGRTGRDWRATTGHYTTLPGALPALYRMQGQCLRGAYGYCD